MPKRWGPGPVFVYESITGARRWQVYALRSLFVLALLLSLTVVWQSLDLRPGINRYTLQQLARVGESFYYGLAGVQLALVMLAAPAATAGAICLDRARGTLTHMLVTDLSDAEIVLGKLAARLAPVFGLIVCGVPVMALAALLGGIIPSAILGLFMISVSVAVLGCALALLVSVRAGKTHEVLMVVYTVWAVWLLFAPLMTTWIWKAFGAAPPWILKLHPFLLAMLPYSRPGFANAVDYAIFLAVTLGASSVIVLMAIRGLRREERMPSAGSPRLRNLFAWIRARLFSWWPNPGLDGNPVLWREWHRNRSSRMARVIWGLFIIFSIAGTAWGIGESVTRGTNASSTIGVNAFHVAFGLLFLSITVPNALSEERTRGSLDVLMSTPLSTASIVLGKWWGAYRRVPWLAVMPGVGAFIIAAAAPESSTYFRARIADHPLVATDRIVGFVIPVAQVLIQGALFTSLGLALATWISRPGRALAVSVSAYLFLTIGWPIIVGVGIDPILRRQIPGNYDNVWSVAQGLLSVSAFGGQIVPLEPLTMTYHATRNQMWIISGAVLVVLIIIAFAVLLPTMATFDRCLGRVSDRPRAASRWRGREKPRTPDPALDEVFVGLGR